MAIEWAEIVTKINKDTVSGSVAPYKPLLILWLIGNYLSTGQSQIPFKDVEGPLEHLMSNFRLGATDPRAALPFVHLASEPLLWRVFSKTGENIYEMDRNTRRRKKYLRDEAAGELNQIFVQEVICNNEVLKSVITAILYEDFPETAHLDILEAVGLASSIQIQMKKRDPKFASLVKRAYEESCAFCGYSGRIDGKLVGVDAAHVKMHSKGGSDKISNGMALCVLHHKLFDRGVMSIDENYRILISQDFILNQVENVPFVMGLNGNEMRRPQSGYSLPDKENIEWHRSKLFRGPARNF